MLTSSSTQLITTAFTDITFTVFLILGLMLSIVIGLILANYGTKSISRILLNADNVINDSKRLRGQLDYIIKRNKRY